MDAVCNRVVDDVDDKAKDEPSAPEPVSSLRFTDSPPPRGISHKGNCTSDGNDDDDDDDASDP